LGIFFPVLVYCAKKNLATLDTTGLALATREKEREKKCFFMKWPYWILWSQTIGKGSLKLVCFGNEIIHLAKKVSPFEQK
jgi:hypothetical protein